MKVLFAFAFLFCPYLCSAGGTEEYFEKIRNDGAALRAFFAQMPKGGDLHHHYSGSVYAETFLESVIAEDYFVDTATLQVTQDDNGSGNSVKFSSLRKGGVLEEYKQKLLRKWSVKDYNSLSGPPDMHFFETFGNFNIASKINYEKGLLEIKERAKKENVSYIETMFTSIPCDISIEDHVPLNSMLRLSVKKNDDSLTYRLLDSLYGIFNAEGAGDCASKFNSGMVERLHDNLRMDDETFTMRYQNYVIRVMEPVVLFRNLIVAFESANKSPLIVGVNIVAPEHSEISMQDYLLHMHMFAFCRKKYPGVNYSMHAGELTLGLVKPEDLGWHINAAVYLAGADRIGHGTDIAYEENRYLLLDHMRKNHIPVEINLVSNEFILKVKDERHPITLYKEFGVPMVISTDDAGVLRTDLTEQFVLLALRYKDFSYQDIKKLVYDSIKYSFIEETDLRNSIIHNLDARFFRFEMLFPLHKEK